MFASLAPELFTFLRSFRKVFLKKVNEHGSVGHRWTVWMSDFLFVLTMETLHVVGVAILAFVGFPQLDTTHAIVLTNCLSVLPSCLLLVTDGFKIGGGVLVLLFNALALLAQVSGPLLWPVLHWTDHSTQHRKLTNAWAVLVGMTFFAIVVYTYKSYTT